MLHTVHSKLPFTLVLTCWSWLFHFCEIFECTHLKFYGKWLNKQATNQAYTCTCAMQSRQCGAHLCLHVWPLIWWHSLRLIKLSVENWVPSDNTKINGDWVLTFVDDEWGIATRVSHVTFCSGAVSKGETVYSLLAGIHWEVDTGAWGWRLTGDSY